MSDEQSSERTEDQTVAAFNSEKAAAEYMTYADAPSELVIAMVGPLGTDNAKIRSLIEARLADFGYRIEIIRISTDVIPAFFPSDEEIAETGYEKHKRLIDRGNEVRRQSCNAAIMAIAAAAAIESRRPNPDGEITKTAYLISSLKLPEEVEELKKIYGSSFFLFAVSTDKKIRIKNLSGESRERMGEHEAVELINRDEHEPEKYGQHTRDTFCLADFFCADEGNDEKLAFSIQRCLDLIFGKPTVTPTFNEFAMFMAFASSLRSGDLSRQVGAVVAREQQILSTGANDCPQFGGGLYWPMFNGSRIEDLPNGRDYMRGRDSNAFEKRRIIGEISDSLCSELGATDREKITAILSKSSLREITEYGRVVHAEMEALLACARSGCDCKGASVFCTTFPCHNCAKHIIAAGVREVIYIEPYPKSKAFQFHDDAITEDKGAEADNRVRFKPFIGVGPRRFFDFFSMALGAGNPLVRKNSDGTVVSWTPGNARPRFPLLKVDHRSFEANASFYLKQVIGSFKEDTSCDSQTSRKD